MNVDNGKLLISEKDKELIFDLAEKMTGSSQKGSNRKEVLVTNVMRCMLKRSFKDVKQYLEFALSHKQEKENLISALTIHTTSWFREGIQIEKLEKHILANQDNYNKKIKILFAACSIGKEPFSFALMFELLREKLVGFDYEIHAFDLDPVSVKYAEKSIFDSSEINRIPFKYHRYILKGSGRTEGLLTFSKDIRSRLKFFVDDLLSFKNVESKYDIVVCRNVLIYFTPQKVDRIVKVLLSKLSHDGILALGHSESHDLSHINASRLGNALYIKSIKKVMLTSAPKVKNVLVVDDSRTIRELLKSILLKDNYNVLLAESAMDAEAKINENQVDLICLDLNMPKKSGAEWLKELRAKGNNVPVVIVSDTKEEEASNLIGYLERIADAYIEKSQLNLNNKLLLNIVESIIEKSSKKIKIDKSLSTPAKIEKTPKLIVIGASTGGPQSLNKLLYNLPKNTPPILVVQHIGQKFIKSFANRLAQISGLTLGEMIDDEELQPGKIYSATGDYHIGIKGSKGRLRLKISSESLRHGHRPSVDVAFESSISIASEVMAIILTGMGRDGGDAIKNLHIKGAITLAQDQKSCVVFGMPKYAIQVGGITEVGDLPIIRKRMMEAINLKSSINTKKVS